MDVPIPGIDGIETMRILRMRGYTRPIICVTAHAMKGDRERLIASGFDAYVKKPLDLALIGQTLDELRVLNYRVDG